MVTSLPYLLLQLTADPSETSLAYSYIISGILEIMIPLALGYYFIHKYKTSWKTFLIGGIMFIISLIRMPLNSYASSTISTMGGQNAYVTIVAFSALTAGVFEESARYIAYRYLVKDHTYGNGLTLGSGHGGAESILLVGVSAAVIGYLLLTNPSAIPANQLASITASPVYLPFVGVFERCMAIIVHVCLSVMVLMTFMTGRKIYYGGAITLHFLLDLFSVLALSYGILYSELVAALFASGLGLWAYNTIRNKEQSEADNGK